MPALDAVSPRDSCLSASLQLLLLGLCRGIELLFVQPAIVDQVFHFPVAVHLEPNLSPSW